MFNYCDREAYSYDTYNDAMGFFCVCHYAKKQLLLINKSCQCWYGNELYFRNCRLLEAETKEAAEAAGGVGRGGGDGRAGSQNKLPDHP